MAFCASLSCAARAHPPQRHPSSKPRVTTRPLHSLAPLPSHPSHPQFVPRAPMPNLLELESNCEVHLVAKECELDDASPSHAAALKPAVVLRLGMKRDGETG
ncbi:hypothetical protein OG21DRAFT_780790 [Imleria badia]|nr:hypothetical protein OG21DRAFT_780790 [Imleria badia]